VANLWQRNPSGSSNPREADVTNSEEWAKFLLAKTKKYLGLEAVDNQIWNVHFGPLRLGRLSEQHMRIEDAYGSLWRHKKKQKL
jgi:hypothetical protein